MSLEFSKSSSRRTRSRYNRKIKIAREKEEEVVRVVKETKKIEIKVLKGDE